MHAITGVSFRERLSGPIGLAVDTPRVGAERGRTTGTCLVADLEIVLQHLDIEGGGNGGQHARVCGTIRISDLATVPAAVEGSVLLYASDPTVGMKRIHYDVRFRGDDDGLYRLQATKFIRPGRGAWREHVTAYARVIAEGAEATAFPDVADPHPSPSRTVAAGILTTRARDVVALLRSVRAAGLSRAAAARCLLALVRREGATPTALLAT